MREARDAPWYVASKRRADNALLVVQGRDHPRLFRDCLSAERMHWINGPPTDLRTRGAFRCTAKTRYRQPDQACTVAELDDGRLSVEFDEPQRTPTPGQYVVLYDGERCLGGAVIGETAIDDAAAESAAAGAAP